MLEWHRKSTAPPSKGTAAPAPAQTVKPDTPIDQKSVNSKVPTGEASFTPNSEPAFTRIQSVNLNTDKELGNPSCSDDFDRFWSAYPQKVAKGAAERLFVRIVKKGEATTAELINGAEQYASLCRAEKTEQRFIKHPTTWLDGGCWSDHIGPSPALRSNTSAETMKGLAQSRELLARRLNALKAELDLADREGRAAGHRWPWHISWDIDHVRKKLDSIESSRRSNDL